MTRQDGDGPLEVIHGERPARPPRPSSGRRRWVAAAVAVAAAVVWWGRLDAVRTGEIAATPAMEIGDPFATTWVPLGDPSGAAADALRRPWPMVADDGRCVGFSRPDLADEVLTATVAHCLVGDGVPPPGSVRHLRGSLAGSATWHFFEFGDEVDAVTVRVRVDGAATTIAPDDVRISGRHGAALLPNGHDAVEVRWTESGGPTYRADFDRDLTPARTPG